jgi:prophage regulatory protein
MTPPSIIRMNQLADFLNESRTTTYNRMNPKSKSFDPTFPKRIRLGARSAGILKSDLDAWIAARKAS